VIASPCSDVCKMDGGGRFCLGCRRTLAEITAWSTASDEERKIILAAVAQRRATLDAA